MLFIVFYRSKKYCLLYFFNQVIKLDNENFHAYHGKANVYDALKKYDQAINWFERALKIDK